MPAIHKIFIVDDDDFYRQMLTDSLSSNPQYVISSFATGEECIQHLTELAPDIIILDYTLNEVHRDAKNGLEILQEIRKILPAAHVIMLSGQNKYGVALKTIAGGAEHYVIKDKDSFEAIAGILRSYE
jgi:two-component system response regulator AtoC